MAEAACITEVASANAMAADTAETHTAASLRCMYVVTGVQSTSEATSSTCRSAWSRAWLGGY